MQDIQIWHNPRCSKSRNALNLLEEKGIEPKVVKYLEETPSKEEIINVLKMLGISAKELLRKGEDEYKSLNLKDETNEDKVIEAMVNHPKLIERPVIIKDGKAVIARPIENLEELLK
ncbi:arsenate reductase [Malaciobacter pacificus]|uniref:Arsenate reductase (ArsC) family protein n=1 Tax=Malaciobacter pacificus TaxID=1080223 RepID=A0A5C2HB12_9BACT|nr:arsenate reductase (glutaredoxin) [Malaciobacter pacificus]QEP34386.1 arsenate reductase (ArsC) family protein [Malaciobacter pacificus]GGD37914.1 arsenate reductase [Malaciobacter pacificus]